MSLKLRFGWGIAHPSGYINLIIMPRPSGDGSMWGAELRVMRESLGVSMAWLADCLEVSVRMIQRWENDAMVIPPGVADQVRDLMQFTADVVDTIAKGARESVLTYRFDDQQQITEPVSGLVLPATWHRLVIARVLERTPGLAVDYVRSAAEQRALDARRAQSPHTCAQ